LRTPGSLLLTLLLLLSAAAPLAVGASRPRNGAAGILNPPAGPRLLTTVPANAFPRHLGFGDPRFGVVEAFEMPRLADDLHVGWERVQIRWDQLQPRGPLQWNANATMGLAPYNQPDAPFNHEIAQGRQLVGVIQGVPAWAAIDPREGNAAVPRNLDLPWNDPRNYWGQFVFRAARHYAGRIDTLIVLNEVNIASGPYRQFRGTVAQYAQMMRVAYLAAHAANPHVEVHLYGDSAYTDQGAWFRATVRALAHFPDAAANDDFFDAAELHLYSSVLQWDRIAATWHAAMRAYGVDHPLWLSETNVSPRDDRDPLCRCVAQPADHNAPLASQPDFIVDAFAAGLGLGFQRLEVYRMLDPQKIWPEHPNGLVRRDGSVRPEYAAFKTVNTWFAGVSAARYQPCATPYVDKSCPFRVTMERPGQEIVVLWNQGGKPARVRVGALAASATVVTPLGATRTVRPHAGAYTVVLPAATDHGVATARVIDIGSAPVIVVQNLPAGRQVPGLQPLVVERDRATGAGATPGPVSGVAVAPDGSGLRALADAAHDRVLIEDAHGRIATILGGTGGAPGRFRGPTGVAIGRDGTLYVADTGNARIQEFDLGGHLLGGFGTYGTTPGALQAPTAVAVAPDNTLWIVDMAQDAVLHFTRLGRFLGRFGGPGYGRGQFDGPGGIATDGGGNVYVADTLNNRVVEFTQRGEPLAQFGSGDAGAGPSSLHWPTAVSILPGGALAIADAANARIVTISHPQTFIGAVSVGEVTAPSGLAIAADGSYFISDSAANRIVHLDTAGHLIAAFGTRGFGQGQFFDPRGLAVGPDGNLYVADHGNNRIEVVTAGGQFVRSIGRQGRAPGRFVGPYSVAVAPDGTLWVADNGNARVQHLTAGGGVLGIDITGVNGVWGVASDGHGGVYYSAHWGQRIYHRDGHGQEQVWGAPGSGAGEFVHPGALAASADGSVVYAVDEGNARVQILTDGRISGERGGANHSAAGLGRPVAVAIAADGSIAVLDAANKRIVNYQGAVEGGFDVVPLEGVPLGLATDSSGQFIVPVCGVWTGLASLQTPSAA
jgi:DNA-binding beta-propeller fold protein YncE